MSFCTYGRQPLFNTASLKYTQGKSLARKTINKSINWVRSLLLVTWLGIYPILAIGSAVTAWILRRKRSKVAAWVNAITMIHPALRRTLAPSHPRTLAP